MTVRDEDKQFIAQIYSYIFIGLMLDWIKDDMREDPQQIVDQACQAHQRLDVGGARRASNSDFIIFAILIKTFTHVALRDKTFITELFLFIVSRTGNGYNETIKEKTKYNRRFRYVLLCRNL